MNRLFKLSLYFSMALLISFSACACDSDDDEDTPYLPAPDDDDIDVDDDIVDPDDDTTDDDDVNDDTDDDTDDDADDDTDDDTDDDIDDDDSTQPTTTTIVSTTTTTTTTSQVGDLPPPEDFRLLDWDTNAVAIAWDPDTVFGEEGYNIYRDTGASAAYELIAELGPDYFFFVDNDAPCEQTIQYIIKTVDDVAPGPASDPVSAQTNPCLHNNWNSEVISDGYVWGTDLSDRFLTIGADDKPHVYIAASPLIEVQLDGVDAETTVLEDVVAQSNLGVAPHGNGEAYLAYRTTDHFRDDVKLYFYDTATGVSTILDESPGAGFWGITTATCPDGYPHIIANHLNEAQEGLYHYWKDAGGWNQEIAGAGGFPHLTCTPDGTLHLIAFTNLGDTHFTRPTSGGWTKEEGGALGPVTSDAAGNLYSIESDVQDSSTLATYSGSWSTETVNGIGGNVNVAVDGNGNPAIAGLSSDGADWTLKYAFKTGGNFSVETITTGDLEGTNFNDLHAIDLAFDSSGNPHIAFEVNSLGNPGFQEIRVASSDGAKGWVTQTAVREWFPGKAMDVESQGNNLFLAYSSLGKEEIHLLSYDAGLDQWADNYVDDAVGNPQLVMRDQDDPALAYTRTNTELVLALVDTDFDNWAYHSMHTSSFLVAPTFGFTMVDTDYHAAVIDYAPLSLGDLMFISGTPGSFTSEVIDTQVSAGEKALLLHNGNTFHVVYNVAPTGGGYHHYFKDGDDWISHVLAIDLLYDGFDFDYEDGSGVIRTAYVNGTSLEAGFWDPGDGFWTLQPFVEDYPLTDPGFHPVSILVNPINSTITFNQNTLINYSGFDFEMRHFGGYYSNIILDNRVSVPTSVSAVDSDDKVHLFFMDPLRADITHVYMP